MSGIKLTYFNLMGRAETTRLILAQAGVAFEDKRIEPADWPALKASLPMGQLPILEVDGKTIGQSMTIARFCGRRFGLAGKDELEGALADQAVDQVAGFPGRGGQGNEGARRSQEGRGGGAVKDREASSVLGRHGEAAEDAGW